MASPVESSAPSAAPATTRPSATAPDSAPAPDSAGPDSAPAHRPRRVAGPWAEGVANWTGRILVLDAIWIAIALICRPFAPGFVDTVTQWTDYLSLPHPTLFSLVLVIVIAGAVMRRFRASLWFLLVVWLAPAILTGIVTAIGVVTGAVAADEVDRPGHLVVSTVVTIALAAILLSATRAFVARLRPGAWKAALVVVVGGVVASVAVTMLLLQVSPGTLGPEGARLRWALSVALGISPQGEPLAVAGDGPHYVLVLGSLISAVGLLLALVLFLRGGGPRAGAQLEEELHVRRLLLQYPSEDSLSYFATREDRQAVFSANGEAGVSYRVVGDVALAAGDPIGDPQHWDDAIERWFAAVREHGWAAAVVGASETGARHYTERGMIARALGDESILETGSFKLVKLPAVRHAIAKPNREGYVVKIARAAEIDPADLAAIVAKSDEWRHGEDRGYSMSLSRFGDPRDLRELVVSAYDADGELRGVLGLVPWGRTGVSLDVMRRSPEAVNGVTELMISQLATQGRAMGIERVSLNFAMLREIFEQGERVGATAWQRLQRWVLRGASRWWQLESLYVSNQKYDPRWRTRYFIVDSAGQSTQALVAYGQAEGFVPELPSLLRRRERAQELDTASGRAQETAAILAQEEELRLPEVPRRKLSDQQRARHGKLDLLRSRGRDPYPVAVPRTHQIAQVLDAVAAAGGAADVAGVFPQEVSVTGRVVRLRNFGGVTFAVLRENSRELQVMVTTDRPDSDPDLFHHAVDLADTISVTGNATRSRSGELTLHAREWTMASKALTPPPDKHKGLQDADQRARLRHVDLALNEVPTDLLRGRSTAVWAMRNVFAERGYIEVETPILQAIHGGANARPFNTHINAYDLDLYLRIAPELFLKRLAVGGFQKVYEIGRNFRNEGVDYKHNPEFTSLEAYEAYADYNTMRELARELIIAAAVAVHGRPIAIAPDGSEVNLDVPWPVVTCYDAVSNAVGESITPDTPIERVRELCGTYDIGFGIDHSQGALVAELYDELVEDSTTFPTFYTDFPKETSPLTREHREDARLAERWDLVAFGAELGTAYSELINPVDQRDRLTRQSLLAALGDPEAMEVDEEFLTALEFGLPPTGGLGLGVDRCYMFVVGATIRETLTFPFTKPQS